MQLIDRDVKCEEMYILKLTEKVKKEIRGLVLSKRDLERKEKPLPKNIYVVYATCLGDAMDFTGSEGFVFDDIQEVLFVDPFSGFGKNRVIAHELIHLFQSRYYFSEGLYDYHDWTESMARDLEQAVETILFKLNKSKLVLVSKDCDEIEGVIEKLRTKDPNASEGEDDVIMSPFKEPPKGPKTPDMVVEEYFRNSLKRHLNMDDEFGVPEEDEDEY